MFATVTSIRGRSLVADLTRSGKPADEEARALKRRRMELTLHALRGDRMRNEVEILEYRDQIRRREEAIVALDDQIQQRERELADSDPTVKET
jgi:hypothetical protein